MGDVVFSSRPLRERYQIGQSSVKLDDVLDEPGPTWQWQMTRCQRPTYTRHTK